MNAPDPLAEFFDSSPRHAPGLSGRSGIHGEVDAALNELEVPATLDPDGDWRLQTDVGPFLLIVDEESSDLVVVQTIQPMEQTVESSADEMHVLLALNFEHRGLARFGAIKDSGQNLLVITARMAQEAVSAEAVRDLLADCMRLSRRVDVLLGNAPADPAPASPGAPPAAADAPPAGDQVIPMAGAPTVMGSVPSPSPEPLAAEPEPAPQPPAPLPPPQPQLPPANWYPDPHGQARLRYWDGQQWTAHIAH